MSSNESKGAFDSPESGNSLLQRRGILGWIIRHPKSAACGLIVLLLVGSCKLLDMQAERAFQSEIDAIRASGAPVTLDDLNAITCDVPDEENIAVLIDGPAEAIADYPLPEERLALIPAIGWGPRSPCGERMRHEHLDATKAYLADIAPQIAEVREALQHERGCRDLHLTSPVLMANLNEQVAFLSWARGVSKTILLEAYVAAMRDDRGTAYQRVLDMVAMDQAIRGDESVIAAAVRMAMRALAFAAAADVVNYCGLDDAQLARLQTEFEDFDWVAVMKRSMEVERVFALDTAQWIMAGNEIGGDWNPSPVIFGVAPFLQPMSNARGLRVFQLLVSAFDRPEPEILEAMRQANNEAAALPTYCILWKMLTPSLTRATTLSLRCVGSQRALVAALACERYRLANGDWPESLDVLVPRYLDAVPLDPFDGKPIRFKRLDVGIVAYSIGEDETDDGGDVERQMQPRDPKTKATDWGYMLLNPELRNREPAPAGEANDTHDPEQVIENDGAADAADAAGQ